MCRAGAYLVDLQSNDSDGGDVGHQKRQAPVTRADWQPCAVQVKYRAEGKIKKNGHILPTGQWYDPSGVKMMH